jgi:hypothetical protein
LNFTDEKKKSSLSEDLTVVLIRGNGSPRSFRLSLPALQRSLTVMGFLLSFAGLAAFFFFLLNFFGRDSSAPFPGENRVNVANSVPSTGGESPAPADAAAQESPGLWQKISGSVNDSRSSDELKREVEGLRGDNAKLNAQLDGRKDVNGGHSNALLQFFGPRSTMIAEIDSIVKVRNPRVVRDTAGKEIYLDFELHNVDPAQRQERGYIVVLAKTRDLLAAYPASVFAPNQNIVLDYTRGETFAVSRFRAARANFSAAVLADKRPQFQILLFGTDGKVLANVHVEGT